MDKLSGFFRLDGRLSERIDSSSLGLERWHQGHHLVMGRR